MMEDCEVATHEKNANSFVELYEWKYVVFVMVMCG